MMTSVSSPRGRVPGSGPRPENHVIVLFGATGDLARRKLLPGLFHLPGASPAEAGCTRAGRCGRPVGPAGAGKNSVPFFYEVTRSCGTARSAERDSATNARPPGLAAGVGEPIGNRRHICYVQIDVPET